MQSIEKLLRALPPGCHYEIEQSDIGRPLCNYDDPAPTCEGPVQAHDIGRRCYTIDGELRIESNREQAARISKRPPAAPHGLQVTGRDSVLDFAPAHGMFVYTSNAN